MGDLLTAAAGRIIVTAGDDIKRLIAEAVIDVELHERIRQEQIKSEKPEALFEHFEILAQAVVANVWTPIIDVDNTAYVERSLTITRRATAAGVAGLTRWRLSVYDWSAGDEPRPCQVANGNLPAAAFSENLVLPIPDNARGFRLEIQTTQNRTFDIWATAYPWREDIALY